MSNTTEISDLLKRDGVITEEQEETSFVRPYTIRKLSSKDISPMLKVLRKLNFKKIKESLSDIDFGELLKASKETTETTEEGSELIAINQNIDIENDEENANNNSEIEKKIFLMNAGKELVFEILPIVLEAIDEALPEINKLLASVINWNVEDVENMDLDLYFTLIFDFIHKRGICGFYEGCIKIHKIGELEFLDLIMRRYSSGLIFLDYCIENSIFAKAVEKVKMKDEEDKMWQLYLSTQPYTDMSFEEWKNKAYKDATERYFKSRTEKMSKVEIDATINKANQILKGFKPLRREVINA